MGGGALLTPILVLIFGFKPTYAVGTDILHGAVFKTFGAVRHRRLGNVHAHLTLWMFAGSGPMSLLGVGTASWLQHAYGDGVQSAEGYAIGAALVLGAIGLAAKTFVKRGVQPSEAGFVLQRKDKVRAVILGAVFGFIVGLTSVGSGTFFGLVMVMIYPLTIARIVGTDIFHAAALLWVAGVGHLAQGNVDLHAMAWLLLGSVPGIWIASRFTLRLPDDALRLGLAGVLALSGVKLLNVPEANWVITAGLGVDADDFLDDVRRLETVREWGIPIDELRARLRDGMSTGRAIAAVYEVYAEGHGKSRWGDKTPMYMRHLRLLRRLFPEAQYVHLIRDGRDAAVSFLSLPAGIAFETWVHPRSAAQFACQWRRDVTAARRLGRGLGTERYLEVRYEDLIADAEPVLRQICAFAGLSYEAGMTDHGG